MTSTKSIIMNLFEYIMLAVVSLSGLSKGKSCTETEDKYLLYYFGHFSRNWEQLSVAQLSDYDRLICRTTTQFYPHTEEEG